MEAQEGPSLAAVSPSSLPHHVHPVEHAQDFSVLLAMQLQAMTWAAQAKDAAIVSIRSKLLIAQAQLSDAVSVNQRLERSLQEAFEREERVQQNLADTRTRLEVLQIAEETLASQMGDLEAESLEQAIADRRRINSLEADLKEKEKILEAMTERLERFAGADASPSSVATDMVAQLELATKRFEQVELKLAETERLWRSKEADLAQAQAEIQKLKDRLMVAEASRVKLENANKHLERLQMADRDEVYSVKVLDGRSVSFKLRAETCAQVPTASAATSCA